MEVQEHGWYHPEKGYWQTLAYPDEKLLATYPKGTAEVPLKPGQFFEFVGGAWVAIAIPEAFKPLTPIDFMLGMLTLNVTPDQVDALIDKLPEPDRMMSRIYWTRAREFVREDPLIDEIAAAFSKTSEDIDRAWRYAMALQPKSS